MGRLKKQPARSEKKVYKECFNNYFTSVFVQDYSEVVISLNQSQEVHHDGIQFSKASLSEETKNIRSGANSFDRISPIF